MLIKAKILVEDKLGVLKTFFTTYRKQNQSPAEIAMYQNKLNEDILLGVFLLVVICDAYYIILNKLYHQLYPSIVVFGF